MVGVQRDAAGLAQVVAEEDPPLGGVHRGHGDGLVPGVAPVQVVLQPVQRQTHGGVEPRVHQRHLLGGVAGLMDEGAAGCREEGHRDEGTKVRVRPGGGRVDVIIAVVNVGLVVGALFHDNEPLNCTQVIIAAK